MPGQARDARGRFTRAAGGGGGLNVGRLFATLDLDTSRFSRGLAGAGVMFSFLSSGLTRLSAMTVMAGGAFSGAIHAAAGLAAAVGAIAPAAAVAAPALLTLAQAGGTLALGFSGVGTALSAFSKQASSAGASAGQSASAQRAAANAIRSATENLASARERAADAYVQAERRNKEAVEAAIDAQDALNDARKEALQRVQDLRREVERSGLSEREAALALRDAERELARVQGDGTASADDQERAVLGYERAKLALSDTREEIGENKKALADMERQGINGQEAVVDAQKAADKAAQNVIETQVEGQKSIRDALKGVEDAERQLAEARLSAAESAASAAGGVNAYAEALAKLPPKTQEFVKAVVALKPQFDRLKVAASEMMPGFTSAVNNLATLFPVLEDGIRRTALGLGDVARHAGEVFSTPAFSQQLGDIMTANADATQNLGMAGVSLAQAFFGVAHAARNAWVELTAGAASGADRIRQWVEEKNATGDLQIMIETAVQALKDLFGTIANILVIVNNVFSAAGIEGGSMLSIIRSITGAIREWTSIPENMAPLKAMFDGFKAGLGGFVEQLGEALQGIGPVIGQLLSTVGGALQTVLPVLGQLVGSVLSALLPALNVLIPHVASFAAILGGALAKAIQKLPLEKFAAALGKILDGLAPLLEPLGSLIAAVLSLAVPLANIVAMAVEALVPILLQLIPIATQIATLFGEYLTQAAGELFSALEPVIPVLVEVAGQLGEALLQAVQDLLPSMLLMITSFVQLLPALVPLLPTLANLLISLLPLITIFAEFATTLLSMVMPVVAKLIEILVWVANGIINAIVIPAVNWLVARFRDMSTVFTTVVGWVLEKGGELLGWFQGLPGALRDKLSGLQDILTAPFKAAFNAVARLWNNSIGGVGFKAPSWVPGVGGKGWQFPEMPYLAKGGTITAGGLAMVGERGPEILDLPGGASVIPLSRAGGGGGGERTTVIAPTFTGPVYADSTGIARLARELVVPVRNEINKYAARNGGTSGLVA